MFKDIMTFRLSCWLKGYRVSILHFPQCNRLLIDSFKYQVQAEITRDKKKKNLTIYYLFFGLINTVITAETRYASERSHLK